MVKLDAYKPTVSRNALVVLAGLFWVAVGVMLLLVAFLWLSAAHEVRRYVFLAAGITGAVLVHHFVFLKIVDRNLARISSGDEKRCLFSFMPWRSYLLVPVMIALGFILRHSALPRHYLAVIYITIGLALILSSVRYLRVFLRWIGREP